MKKNLPGSLHQRGGSINIASELSTQMLQNLKYTAENSGMIENFVELLSGTNIIVKHRIVTGVEITQYR